MQILTTLYALTIPKDEIIGAPRPLVLLGMLSDLLGTPDVLFVVRSGGATCEMRSGDIGARQKDRWITLGQNDGPAHMHVDSEAVRRAEFVKEERPGRTSFSARFYDAQGSRILAAFFTKMYDESGSLVPSRVAAYESLAKKYGQNVEFKPSS